MFNKKNLVKQILPYAAGMGTELLYATALVAVAFAISALASRWF